MLLFTRYVDKSESQTFGSILQGIPKYWNIKLGTQDMVNKLYNPVALAHDTSVTCSFPLLAWYNNQVSKVPNCTSFFLMSCLNFRLFCNNHRSLGKIYNKKCISLNYQKILFKKSHHSYLDVWKGKRLGKFQLFWGKY